MPFIPGDYNMICDRCGGKFRFSQMRKTWDGLWVDKDCWQPRHPQDFVKGISERQTVPVARPDVEQTYGSTTLSSAVSRGDVAIQVASIAGITSGDAIGVELDNGAAHWTFADGAPSGSTIALGSPVPDVSAVGNTVYTPSVSNKENWVTASTITASSL